MSSSDPVGRVREARRRISSEHDNDTRKLLAHYERLQERYRDRLVRVSQASSAHGGPAPAAGGASHRG